MQYLSLRPKEFDWTILKYKLPDEFLHLCGLCTEYDEVKNQIFENMPNISIQYGELNLLIQNIISEYKRIMRVTLDEKTMEGVDKDIQAILSRFIVEGRIMIPTEEFRTARDEGWLDVFLSAYVCIFDSFMESRIYAIIKNIITNKNKFPDWFIKEFTVSSGRAADIYPEFRPKEGEEIVAAVKKAKKKPKKEVEE